MHVLDMFWVCSVYVLVCVCLVDMFLYVIEMFLVCLGYALACAICAPVCCGMCLTYV